MIAVEFLMMLAFMVGAIVGNEADVRAAEREIDDDAWADEFVSVLHGTSPDLFTGTVTVDLTPDTTEWDRAMRAAREAVA